jgi:hypothetical protein
MNDFIVAYKFINLNPKRWADIISWFLFNSDELNFRYNEELKFQTNMKNCWRR